MFTSIWSAIQRSLRRSRENTGLPFVRQLWEMAFLQLTTNLGPGNYHKYRLWRKDIPWEEKRGYWHDQSYYDFLNRVNPNKYRIIARNKVLAKALLHFYGVEDAPYLGYLSRQGSFTSRGDIIGDNTALEAWLNEGVDFDKICFKPVEGSGGEGFFAVRLERGKSLRLVTLNNKQTRTVGDFIAENLNGLKSTDYIIEAYIDQHSVLAQFNATSLNTVRVWVGKSARGDIKIAGIYLRVGRAGSLVDNRLSGGFGIEIDQQSFITKAAIPQDGEGQEFNCHPDSGFDMTGITLPFRDEVIALSEKIINILPHTQFVGLDIAFAKDKPVIIEFNLTPTAIGACVLQKSHQRLLSWIEGK